MKERRKFPRVRVDWKMMIEGEHRRSVDIVDISYGGVGFIADGGIKKGDSLQMEFMMDEIVVIMGEVRHVEEIEGEKIRVGVEFYNPPPAFLKDKIQFLIEGK